MPYMDTMTHSNFHITIIGAGVAGLTLSARLREAGIASKVFEKSRGVGGRMATRRTPDGLQFDHGAPYFTARSTAFKNTLETNPWAENTDVWLPDGIKNNNSDQWLVGAPTMKSPIRALANALDIQLNAKIESLEPTDHGWRLCGDGIHAQSDIVIISAPAPQAMTLTPFSPHLQTELAAVQYEPCWTLMVAMENKTNICPAALEPSDGVLSWIARNSAKPRRDGRLETWVAHATPGWSKHNLEIDTISAPKKLLPHLLKQISAESLQPSYVSAHRWRYARTTKPLGKPFLHDETGTVFIIGDGCLGPLVENAFESGNTLADHLINQLKT